LSLKSRGPRLGGAADPTAAYNMVARWEIIARKQAKLANNLAIGNRHITGA
jgi:hypothetical protein